MRCALRAAVLLLSLAPAHAQNPTPNLGAVQVRAMPVQGSVYRIAGPGGNTTVQIGPDGVLVVDPQDAPSAPQIMAEIRKLSDKPIVWIIDTHVHTDHISGNAALARLGASRTGQRARIIAFETVLHRMTERLPNQPPVPDEDLPTEEYGTPQKDLYFNGEAVVIYHLADAHTDGDSIVFFRRSDVLSTGDIFTPGRWPVIDVVRGGSVQGTLEALNYILTLTIPEQVPGGGTLVVPGSGRLCNEADVSDYRDMLQDVAERVQNLIKQSMTLEQVIAAHPARDYQSQYRDTGSWNQDQFVEAVYRSLSASSRK